MDFEHVQKNETGGMDEALARDAAREKMRREEIKKLEQGLETLSEEQIQELILALEREKIRRDSRAI